MSFFEDADAIADNDVALFGLEVDEDDVGAFFLHLLARRQIFTGHSTCLQKLISFFKAESIHSAAGDFFIFVQEPILPNFYFSGFTIFAVKLECF